MKEYESSYLQKIRDALHLDLEEWLCEEETGFIVDHPLVRASVADREYASSLNKMYESKVVRMKRAIKDSDWDTYVKLHERPYRLDAFLEIKEELRDRSYWEMLAEVWMDTECPWQNQSDWALWGGDRPQKQCAMSRDDREALALLPNQLTIYRGVAKGNNVNGLSWTLSRETAIWFVRRFRGDGLITATAKRQDVHAFLSGRQEQEIVVEHLSITSRETLPNVTEGSSDCLPDQNVQRMMGPPDVPPAV